MNKLLIQRELSNFNIKNIGLMNCTVTRKIVQNYA